MLDGWLGGWLISCCGVSGTMVTLVDVDCVVCSGGGWLDVTDVEVVAGVVEELVADVVGVGTGSPTYLTLELRFLRTSCSFGQVVSFSFSLMSESS